MSGNSVLFFTYWYPNKNSKSFGIFIKRHAQAIARSQNIVVLNLLIESHTSIFKTRFEVTRDEAQIQTHTIILSSRFRKLLYVFIPLHVIILKRYIKKEITDGIPPIKFVHSNILFPCALVGHKLANMLNGKHIISEHWTKIDKFFSRSIYRFKAKTVLDKADAITCVSPQLLNTVAEYTSNEKMFVVPNVIDSKNFYYDPNAVKYTLFTFIAAANWSQHKNPFYFLDAMQLLYIEGLLKEFQMVIIGDGDQITKIKSANYKFPIIFKGTLSSDEIRDEMNKSHVFVHGSDFETFSVIIAEALMCGLPSVVSPVGIAPEVITPMNGYIAENNPLDWKTKLLMTYNKKYNNIEIAEQLKNRFDEQTIAKSFENVYALIAHQR